MQLSISHKKYGGPRAPPDANRTIVRPLSVSFGGVLRLDVLDG